MAKGLIGGVGFIHIYKQQRCLLERLQLLREEEDRLLDHGGDGSPLKSGGFTRYNMNAMRHNSRMARITVFAEVVRLLDWIVIL